MTRLATVKRRVLEAAADLESRATMLEENAVRLQEGRFYGAAADRRREAVKCRAAAATLSSTAYGL